MSAPTPAEALVRAAAFRLPAPPTACIAFGSGHINDTFHLTVAVGPRPQHFILQRLNPAIFPNAAAVMHNIQRVTTHVAGKVSGMPHAHRRVLSLIPTHDQGTYTLDAQGAAWRCFDFIEGARAFDHIESTAQAWAAAKAFGTFQRQLSDLPGRLHETLPRFHDTRWRYDNLMAAVRADPAGRVAEATAEIAFCRAHEWMVDRLLTLKAEGILPERVTHNDTKINNVLIDEVTGEGLCVMDLDTVMPGLVAYDFGDMCRTGCCPCAEDETDLERVAVDLRLFKALADGFLAGADFLLPAERAELAFSARLITLEIGIRFLEDFLRGDVYYKTHRAKHNLDRARVQLALVDSFDRQAERMEAIIRDAAA